MIDLHTHTTASDGKHSPDVLVALAAGAGVTTLGLTDHDTIAGCEKAAAACARHGIEFIPGIEITAVENERDVHVLAYFFDLGSTQLLRFLGEQREHRVTRVRAMLERLAQHGMSIDADAVLGPALADRSRTVGRPNIARAMVDAGYVSSIGDAFDKWLSRGRPGFVSRHGASPADVFARVHEAGGLASLAHPVLVEHDEWLAGFAASGLDAIEAFHSAQSSDDTHRYLAIARNLGLLVTGGSDFHGSEHGGGGPGSIALPRAEFERLQAWRAGHRTH